VSDHPVVRLAVGGREMEGTRVDSALERPVVRMACNGQGQGEVNGSAFEAPTVRMAVSGAMSSEKVAAFMPPTESPTVRMAIGNGTGNADGRCFHEPPAQPTVRLAVAPHGVSNSDGRCFIGAPEAPALLVSYVYAEKVRTLMPKWHYRDWVLDSGAYSAFNSGVEIQLQDYIDYCKRLKDEDQTLTEVFALDVIGDWRASVRNCEEMWRQGVEAIPCFHQGEPEELLRDLARDYPKIALGGVVGVVEKKKLAWCQRCFDRIWPKRVHGFGMSGEKLVLALPFDSVDATNWQIGPTKFGRWRTLGNASWRGSQQNLRSEVQWYLDLERRARDRWRATWQQTSL